MFSLVPWFLFCNLYTPNNSWVPYLLFCFSLRHHVCSRRSACYLFFLSPDSSLLLVLRFSFISHYNEASLFSFYSFPSHHSPCTTLPLCLSFTFPFPIPSHLIDFSNTSPFISFASLSSLVSSPVPRLILSSYKQIVQVSWDNAPCLHLPEVMGTWSQKE